MRLHPEERVRAFTEAGWWGPDTWDSLLRGHAASRPDAPAVADPPNRLDLVGGPAARWSWAELDVAVDRWAAGLQGVGIRPGDVVGIQLPNVHELVVGLLACARIGAIASPFPVPYQRYELVQLCGRARARALITAGRILGRDQRSIAEEVLANVNALEHLLLIDADTAGAPALDSLPAATPSPVAVHPNDAVTICWTSGTEATPKGVPRCANDWGAIATGTIDAAGLTSSDVLLNPFPMVNMGGIGGMFVPWLKTGGHLVLHHPFDLRVFLGQIADEGVNYTQAAPALLIMLLRDAELAAGFDVSTLRLIGSGSAPLSPWMIREWKLRHGVDVANMFGSNEGTVLIADAETVPDPEDRAIYFPRFGSQGLSWSNRAAAMVRTKLVDPATREEITEPGAVGELWTSGATVVAGYLDEENADAFADGWFRSGDLFELVPVEDGPPRYMRFVDRARDIVIRGGMKIAAAEVEGLLASHPDVVEVAVVSYPDDVLGERAAAVVVARPDAPPVTLDGLVEHLRAQRVASYKLPERLVVVESLPRNPVGKVLKRELRRVLAGEEPAR